MQIESAIRTFEFEPSSCRVAVMDDKGESVSAQMKHSAIACFVKPADDFLTVKCPM